MKGKYLSFDGIEIAAPICDGVEIAALIYKKNLSHLFRCEIESRIQISVISFPRHC